MKHRIKARTLGREKAHRTALLRNMAVSLILHESITTTEGKAKELRRYVEPLITKAAKKDLGTIRSLHGELPEQGAVKKLLEQLGPKYAERPGGYVRLIKIGTRPGDGARSVKVELV